MAGQHPGRFTEAMFAEGQHLPSPYHATKYEAERIVREDAAMPWRVYRPAVVVGDSRTGEMDNVDGPYYLFPALAGIGDLPGRGPCRWSVRTSAPPTSCRSVTSPKR